MPIYEYHCDDCGTDFERLVMRNDEKVACACGSAKVTRRMSVFAARVTEGVAAKSAPAPACTSCGCAGGACGIG